MNLSLWGIALLPFITAGLGAYLGGYLKTKGENLATHEDIAKLDAQVRVVTTTTEEIKAKISDEVWNRQKRWELKREVLFDAVKRLAEMDEALLGLNTKLVLDEKPIDELSLEIVAERKGQWAKAAVACNESRQLIGIVCEKETIHAFSNFLRVANQVAQGILSNKDEAIYEKSQTELAMKLYAARDAVRKELGIDGAQW